MVEKDDEVMNRIYNHTEMVYFDEGVDLSY